MSVRHRLLAISPILLLIVCAGCAQLHRTPDLCAHAIDRCQLVRELGCFLDCHCGLGGSCRCATVACGDASCPPAAAGDYVDYDAYCGDGQADAGGCPVGGVDASACAAGVCERPRCGPPPIRYRPPEPPTFLTVPTRPVHAGVPEDAPLPARGSVEVGFRPELTFTGRD